MASEKIIPVILCGGSGTRLWPASRETYPKQFLNLLGDFTLLQNTMRRALRVAKCPAENIVTVTLGALANEVEAQLAEIHPGAANHILREPSARNTAAAVAFAGEYIRREFGPEAIMWVLPADHHIGDEVALAGAYEHALKAAKENYLMTFGIKPTRPDTGYGYIRVGDRLNGGGVNMALAFVEKPDLATAQIYLDAGDYLWNSGMFLFETGALLKEYEAHAPQVLSAVTRAMEGADGDLDAHPELYAAIPEQPFDKAIMEKSARVAIAPCDPSWSDIGSWESLWEMKEKDANGNALEGRAVCHGTEGSLIKSNDRLIAVAGLKNVVVVETPDAILIADRSNGDAMRALVKGLKANGAPEVTQKSESFEEKAAQETRPWSLVKPLTGGRQSGPTPGIAAQELFMLPGQSLAFDGHAHEIRFWTVTAGGGYAIIDGEKQKIKQHDAIFIPKGVSHAVRNDGGEDLRIIEVSQGNAEARSSLRRFGKIRNGREAA